MPLLRSGADRCVLRPGTNTLGGRGQDALPVPALAWQPAVATITVQPLGPVLIQRTTASVVVRLNDEPLGVGPAELRHGAHIDFAGCRLTFDAEQAGASGTSTESTAQVPVSAAPEERARVAPPSAQLLHLSTGRVFTLPGRRVVVGRDDGCDLRLDGEGVSRRHCAISPVPGGYLMTDESSNGTLVNGGRVGRTHILDDGDILRLHDEELRFELIIPESEKSSSAAPESTSRAATAVLDLSRLRAGELTPDERRAALRPSPTATLEIIRGPFTGAAFHIAKPVVSIGRGEHSDVRLRDDSVSATHATLLRKGNTWYVIDLRSVNGTFVDSYRIAGERELPTGATLRVGAVELLFRSFSNGTEDPLPRRERKGLIGAAMHLWRMAFPKPAADE